MSTDLESPPWQQQLFEALHHADVKQVAYVPDAGHRQIIERVHQDPAMRPIVLTSEQEGIATCCGAWLGGEKSVLLMQSSGVGNCINMLSLVSNCQFPFLSIITMRGEWAEYNSWQCAMGQAAQQSLELMGVQVLRCDEPAQVKETVAAALYATFVSNQRIAVLLSQRLIGGKVW